VRRSRVARTVSRRSQTHIPTGGSASSDRSRCRGARRRWSPRGHALQHPEKRVQNEPRPVARGSPERVHRAVPAPRRRLPGSWYRVDSPRRLRSACSLPVGSTWARGRYSWPSRAGPTCAVPSRSRTHPWVWPRRAVTGLRRCSRAAQAARLFGLDSASCGEGFPRGESTKPAPCRQIASCAHRLVAGQSSSLPRWEVPPTVPLAEWGSGARQGGSLPPAAPCHRGRTRSTSPHPSTRRLRACGHRDTQAGRRHRQYPPRASHLHGKPGH